MIATPTSKDSRENIIPLVIVGIMFFVIGFAFGINSYIIPLLNNTLGISSGQSYLVMTATYSSFLIFSFPASATIKSTGYKKTMALSFLMFAVGFYLFIPSAKNGSLLLFLLASFVCGMGNAFLQASVNPYVTILGPIESAAKRMSFMGIANKLAWPVSPLFLALLIGKNVKDVNLADIYFPFYIIIGIFIAIGLFVYFSKLPEVSAVGEESNNITSASPASGKTSIFQFPHLILGSIALFLYTGAETISLGTLVDYAVSLDLPNANLYAWIAPSGMTIGYICGIIFIPKYLSQSKALLICSIVALIGVFLVISVPSSISIYFVFLMALGCSLMWPALWPLAITGLGKYTKAGSSLLVTAIVGGAILPTVYGFLKDTIGAQNAYWIAIPCFIFILYYARTGHKIRR
jgi:glucose/galactose transporter